MFDLAHPEQFKQAAQASFDTTAASYGTADDFHWQFAERLLVHAPLAAGQCVLDVATGTAPAARLAVRHVLPTGLVIGTDISRGILRLARTNITSRHATTILLACADAERLPFGAASIDGIVCSSAIVWFPDHTAALHDWYRILRPNGWLAFSCFGGAARQTLISHLAHLLHAYSQHLPELNGPFNTPEKCQTLLTATGYTHITVHTGPDSPLPMPTAASFAWAWASHQRFGVALTNEQRIDLQARYARSYPHLVATSGDWNHDYEQYVVAYKAG